MCGCKNALPIATSPLPHAQHRPCPATRPPERGWAHHPHCLLLLVELAWSLLLIELACPLLLIELTSPLLPPALAKGVLQLHMLTLLLLGLLSCPRPLCSTAPLHMVDARLEKTAHGGKLGWVGLGM